MQVIKHKIKRPADGVGGGGGGGGVAGVGALRGAPVALPTEHAHYRAPEMFVMSRKIGYTY